MGNGLDGTAGGGGGSEGPRLAREPRRPKRGIAENATSHLPQADPPELRTKLQEGELGHGPPLAANNPLNGLVQAVPKAIRKKPEERGLD